MMKKGMIQATNAVKSERNFLARQDAEHPLLDGVDKAIQILESATAEVNDDDEAGSDLGSGNAQEPEPQPDAARQGREEPSIDLGDGRGDANGEQATENENQ